MQLEGMPHCCASDVLKRCSSRGFPLVVRISGELDWKLLVISTEDPLAVRPFLIQNASGPFGLRGVCVRAAESLHAICVSCISHR